MPVAPASISVVLPSYNERDNIAEAVRRIVATLGTSLLEVIVVDDNSPDETWRIVEGLHEPRCRLIRRIDKRGLASALADGTRAAKGEIIVWLDCDLGIPPEDILKLVEQLDTYEAAIGSRYVPGGLDTRPKFRGFLSVVFNVYTRLLLGWHFWDWTSGFAAARRDVMERVPLSPDGFGEYFIEWVYGCTKKGIKMVEVPYRYGLRKAGVSKTDSNVLVFLKLGWRYALRVLAIRMGRTKRTSSAFAGNHCCQAVEKCAELYARDASADSAKNAARTCEATTDVSRPSFMTSSALPPYTTITRCRVCGSKNLSALYSLGTLYVSNFVDSPEDGIKAPLAMVMCEQCKLVQLKDSAPQEILYSRFYWYRSGVTDTMKKALRNITEDIEQRVPLQAGDIVLDIGSNDGTMLRTYAVPGLVTVGVEPASNLAEEGVKGLTHFINDFWTIGAYEKAVPKKAKVITAIGMFYDMEDPNQFIADAAKALDASGIFVAQLMCLKNMLDTNDVGNICHEHLEFYSLASLEYLLEKNGFELLDISHNLVNGGSYRVFCGLKGGAPPPMPGGKKNLAKFRREEEGIDTKEVHQQFFSRIEESKRQCVEFIRGEVAKGKTVWAYGASTKGNTILQYYGLDHRLIAGASERSPEKWGKFTVGTGIPIFSEEEARKAKPDYFLVLPYAFFDEFHKREEAWRKGGGRFIVPLPTFRVVP